MNNNFEENREFVRRPTAGDVRPGNTPPRSNGESPRNRGGNGNFGYGPASRPQNVPQRGTQPRGADSDRERAVRRPAPTGGETPKRRDTSRPAPAGDRITPDRVGGEKRGRLQGVFCIKNILMFTGMLVGLLLLVWIAVFTFLGTAKETPKAESKGYTVLYYEGMGDEAKPRKYPSYELGGVSYINMTAIADICGMTVSGGKGSLRFGSGDSEFAEFSAGSGSAHINGENIVMGGNAIEREPGSIWIPLEFAMSLFSEGVEIATYEKEAEVSVRKTANVIKFSVKGVTGLGPVDGDPDMGQDVELGFMTDLSEYEQYMNPENRDDFLVLVNKTNHIDSTYIPENLIPVASNKSEQMVETAAKALEAMLKELKAAGYGNVNAISCYRSYARQESIFARYISNETKAHPDWTEEQVREFVLTYSAAPGTSEHQTGLVCDMNHLDVSFAETDAYKWLKENCWKFGFVIRFPEDKVDITGYSFEPWHYRFVGRHHASAMNRRGMCLEEYTRLLGMSN